MTSKALPVVMCNSCQYGPCDVQGPCMKNVRPVVRSEPVIGLPEFCAPSGWGGGGGLAGGPPLLPQSANAARKSVKKGTGRKKMSAERTKKALELLQAVEDIDTSSSRMLPRVDYAGGLWWGSLRLGEQTTKDARLVEALIALAKKVRSF